MHPSMLLKALLALCLVVPLPTAAQAPARAKAAKAPVAKTEAKAAKPECYKVVPGVAIGPVAVDQPRGSAPLPPNLEVFPGASSATIGSVGLDLLKAPCFVLDGKTIRVTGRRPEAVASQIGCGPVELAIGANNIYCRGGKLGLVWNERDGLNYLSLRALGPAAAKNLFKRSEPVCDAYLLPGRSIVTADKELKASAKEPAGLPVARGKHYCFHGRVVTSDWVEQRIWEIPARSCGERRQGKQKVISCDYWGIRFFFGPKLTKVEIYPARP